MRISFTIIISFAFIIKSFTYKKSHAAFDMYICRQPPYNKQITCHVILTTRLHCIVQYGVD